MPNVHRCFCEALRAVLRHGFDVLGIIVHLGYIYILKQIYVWLRYRYAVSPSSKLDVLTKISPNLIRMGLTVLTRWRGSLHMWLYLLF
nr:MAG TPA: hypothetical protein [Caudoviricetes sp.]